MIPYNQKLWGVHPREITAEWCSRFVPIPKLEDVIKGAVGDVPPEIGYNVSFLYPREGGIETLTRALVARLQGGEVHAVDARREGRISASARSASAARHYPWRALVATIPLPELVARLVDAPHEIEEAARKLRCTPVRYLERGDQDRRPTPTSTGSTSPRRSTRSTASASTPTRCRRWRRPGAARSTSSCPIAGPCRASTTSCPTWRRRSPPPAPSTAADDVLFAEIKELKYAYVVFDDNYYSCVDQLIRYFEVE